MEPGLECLVAPLCQHPGQLAAFADGWRKPGHLLRVALAARYPSGVKSSPPLVSLRSPCFLQGTQGQNRVTVLDPVVFACSRM